MTVRTERNGVGYRIGAARSEAPTSNDGPTGCLRRRKTLASTGNILSARRCTMAWSTNTPRSAIIVFCGGDAVHFDVARGVERRQVVATQMPATPDPIRFDSALLFEPGAPRNPKAGLAGLERLTRDMLRRIAPRMLIVDEVHHLLSGRFANSERRSTSSSIWPTIFE